MGLVILVLALLAGGAIAVGNGRLSRSVAGMEAALPTPIAALRTDLPPIVERFARRNGAGQAGLCAQRLTQVGALRKTPGGAFSRVQASQRMTLGAPGFVWSARGTLGGLPLLRVIDRYAEGTGVLDVWVFGLVQVAEAHGDQTNLSEAMRYLAELPWMPDAIMLNADIAWEQVDDSHVAASLATSGGVARVVLGFDAAGDITEISAQDRPAVEGDKMVLRDWRGLFSDYRKIGPRRIPTRGQVGYVYDDGFEVYFDGTILDLRLERCAN
ncbi:DUF6544 family protein [Actibacterium sp. XHP0104]|uniref:DUF6544 family protein n=1 Tax=Actibacterium sp. XHP0104 TaxID=2984335 RepID=UPI0021E86C66|nr:DUF6544 family protein [Actibacterium sp. XHP0104]MCV2882232.1 hypothetical protein [Actibacterium sp. XHP0104]